MEAKAPVRESQGLRIYHEFQAGNRYGAGGDVAGGVGLDSSTSVWIDFECFPCRVAATYDSNEIQPEDFGYELARQGEMYGFGIIGVENNKFDGAIVALKKGTNGNNGYKNIYKQEDKRIKVKAGQKGYVYGWNTNSTTKSQMLYALQKAVENGHLELSDPALIAELRSYGRDDLMEDVKDPRLVTKHYDLLIACAIAWQMKDHATYNQPTHRSNVSEYVF